MPRIPNQKSKYKELTKRTGGYIQSVLNAYATFQKELSRVASTTNYDFNKGIPFDFSSFPETRAAVRKSISRLTNSVTATIYNGTTEEWRNSNIAQDLIANKVLKSYTGEVNKKEYTKYYETNSDVLRAFQNRKLNGKSISENIWDLSSQQQKNIEAAISCSLERGTSAITLSKQISQYLKDFPSLKKDYAERYGEATDILDCEYRAARLARSEINMAYRTAEQKRWEQFDFVVGYEIKTTDSDKHVEDICDELAGKYPKDFEFVGWHPNCMCYTVPILKSEDEFWDYDHDNPTPSENEVTDVPENFKEWVRENRDRIETAKSQPYFIRDNQKIIDDIFESSDKEIERIKNNIDLITKPLTKNLYVSFEPFSPIIANKLNEIRDKKDKIKLFNDLLNDDVFITENTTDKGVKTVTHPLHKTKDKYWPKTLLMAKELNLSGKNIIFLPEYENAISADALMIFNGRPTIVDFKFSTSTKSNTIQRYLSDGFKQAGCIVLKLENMDSGQFSEAIEYMKRNNLSMGNIILMNKYGKSIELTSKTLLTNNYKNKIRGFL